MSRQSNDRHRSNEECSSSREIVPQLSLVSDRMACPTSSSTRTSYDNKRKRIIKAVNGSKPMTEARSIGSFSEFEQTAKLQPMAGPSHRSEKSMTYKNKRKTSKRTEADSSHFLAQSLPRRVERPNETVTSTDRQISCPIQENISAASGFTSNLSWKNRFEGSSRFTNASVHAPSSSNDIFEKKRNDSNCFIRGSNRNNDVTASEVKVPLSRSNLNKYELKYIEKIKELEVKCMSYQKHLQEKDNQLQEKDNLLYEKIENEIELKKSLEHAQDDKIDFKEKWLDLKRIKQNLKEKVDKQAEEISLLKTMKNSLKDEIKKQDEQISILRRKPLDIDYLFNRLASELTSTGNEPSAYVGIQQLTEQKNSLAMQLREAFQNNENTIQDIMKSFKDLVESQLQCSICSDIIAFCTTITCGHTFCTECIEEWKKYKNNCPICRSYIRYQVKTSLVDNFIDKFIEGFVPEAYKIARKELLEERKRKEIDRETARLEIDLTDGATEHDAYHHYENNQYNQIEDESVIDMVPGLDVTTPSLESSILSSPILFSTPTRLSPVTRLSPETVRSLHLNPPAMRSPTRQNRETTLYGNNFRHMLGDYHHIQEMTINLDLTPIREEALTPVYYNTSRSRSRSRTRSSPIFPERDSFSSSTVSQYLGRSETRSGMNGASPSRNSRLTRYRASNPLDISTDLTYSPEEIIDLGDGMSGNSHYGSTLRNDDSFSVIEASISYNVQSAFSDDEI